jgi:hypothetical protein
MAMTQCSAGHFYSPAQHSSCPYCGVPDLHVDKTVPKRPEAEGGAQKAHGTAPRGGRVDGVDKGKTVGIVQKQLGVNPTVGWLVCIGGPDRGRDYRIRSGRNFIGRAEQMHICIEGDPAITREKHAVISHDPKQGRFMLLPGDGSGLTYLNDNPVEVPTELKARDTIELGETKLVFVPFCGEDFQWRTDEPPGKP